MTPPQLTSRERARLTRYLVDERAEAEVYRRLAERRDGEERKILLELAEAEGRHERHWLEVLGGEPARLPRRSLGRRILAWMARRFGSVFVIALVQSAEARSPYGSEKFATAAMIADEQVHHEVVRELAAQGRRRLSGTFRAAVFGMNDGLVSNLALVIGIGATGVAPGFVLFSGIAGLLAGALSMGAGEFVSVRSQRELLRSTEAGHVDGEVLPDLDVDANEVALVFRARGMSEEESLAKAEQLLKAASAGKSVAVEPVADVTEVVGSDWGAATSSFLFFASGAVIPILPWIFGLSGTLAIVLALVLVGIVLMITGAFVGILSGTSPLLRALRQLAIGLGAAGITYLLGRLFGVAAG